MEVPDDVFEKMIGRALEELPERYVKNLDNVVITYDDVPSREQRVKQRLRDNQTLFGLYEGIPLTRRGAGYNLVLPDKITIFKLPMAHVHHNLEGLYQEVKHTLWHEIAHFYGLDHDRIHEIEASWK